MIMEIGLDIIDFDAWNYLPSFALYTEPLRRFLEVGGAVGWGIVPTDEEALKGVEVSQLVERLKAAIDQLVNDGVPRELLCESSIITPSCGADSLSEGAAKRVYQLTQEVADTLRESLAL